MQKDVHVQCGRHICSGAHTNNVKCKYTSDTVDGIEFIGGVYTDIAV